MDEKKISASQVKQENKKKDWEVDQFGRALFEQTGECVFIIGMDLRYLTANRQARLLLGYSEEELTGMNVSNVIWVHL